MELIVFIADAAAAVYFLLLDDNDCFGVELPHLVVNIVSIEVVDADDDATTNN
jgi:hypothetical protein